MIPHAGGDGLFPENTMLAYERTVAMGADVVDVDVRMSRDGVLVAFHDATLERTTDGTGRLAAHTYADLARFDAGWDFTRSGRTPFRGKGLRVPTLEAVVRRFPNVLLSIDLKDERVDLVEPTCRLLRSHGRRSDVFVGSNRDEQIFAFRRLCPDVRTSFTLADVFEMRDARASRNDTYSPKAFVDQPPFRGRDGTKIVTKGVVEFAHSKGIAILPWVVDDPEDMRELIGFGVDGIYTRRPDVLLSILQRSRREPRPPR